MLLHILQRTPVWVWLMLAALLVMGLSQLRTRQVTPARLSVLPAVLLVMGVWTMAPGFVALPLVGGLWLLVFGAATWAGRRLPPPAGARWLAPVQRLQLPGSAVPLLVIVGISSLRCGAGVAQALHPAWRTLATVQAPLALLFGSLSGLLLGRALAVRALAVRSAH
ncbi:MAG: hypothetical protein LH480_00830 [Rubrivivax sp.]|nr:hypothetical protein [Rubrivivax sp.]